jgi:hypothetical protein
LIGNCLPAGRHPELILIMQVTCAICYEESDERVSMPCCGTRMSSIQYCRRCIEIVVERGLDCGGPKLGRCPTCSRYFSIENGYVRSVEQLVAKCRICQQHRNIVDTSLLWCELCLLGSRHPYEYECARCHGFQQIFHPMWRYQASPMSYGTTTWACHKGCADFTCWRVRQEDAGSIPPELCPESWGRREEWLAAIRAQRRAETSRKYISPWLSRTTVVMLAFICAHLYYVHIFN